MKRTFYVCSYGGCGSTYLCEMLKQYGSVEHIHSREPPELLEYVGGENTYKEWFNGQKIPEPDLQNVTVIYIFKDPVKAIFSRFHNPLHLRNIQIEYCTIKDVIEKEEDLFRINDFFTNYTTSNTNRNYKIICVKYEQLFEKQNELCKLLNIGPLNLVKIETDRQVNKLNEDQLNIIYKDLKNTMENMDFITIV